MQEQSGGAQMSWGHQGPAAENPSQGGKELVGGEALRRQCPQKTPTICRTSAQRSNYQELQAVNNRALNQVWALVSISPCPCTDQECLKPVLPGTLPYCGFLGAAADPSLRISSKHIRESLFLKSSPRTVFLITELGWVSELG